MWSKAACFIAPFIGSPHSGVSSARDRRLTATEHRQFVANMPMDTEDAVHLSRHFLRLQVCGVHDRQWLPCTGHFFETAWRLKCVCSSGTALLNLIARSTHLYCCYTTYYFTRPSAKTARAIVVKQVHGQYAFSSRQLQHFETENPAQLPSNLCALLENCDAWLSHGQTAMRACCQYCNHRHWKNYCSQCCSVTSRQLLRTTVGNCRTVRFSWS